MSNISDLLEAQAHIWNHIFNFINSASLKCAVELGIPDIIHSHGKPVTISELNSALSIHPTKARCVPRLMHILIHSGFFALTKTNQNPDEKEEEGYILTESSRLLLKDNPLSVRPFLLNMLDPILIKPWDFFSKWFRNDDNSPFDSAHGMSFWDYVRSDSNFSNSFNEAMASDTRLVSKVLIDDGKQVFAGLSSVVDVGGGTGTLAKAIAESFPHIHCTVLDLHHVVAGLPETQNLKFVAGNMYEKVPPADAVLLKWMLHDLSDEECVKVLVQCRIAIKDRKGGKLIIINMVKQTEETIETQLYFDMVLMVLAAGQERTEHEWVKLFSDAGFSGYKIIPILGLRSIIEVYP